MKGKEDMAVKCALAGGALGVLLGAGLGLLGWSESGGGPVAALDVVLEVLVWGVGCALAGGVVGYVGVFVAERKLGVVTEDQRGPGAIVLKTSYLRGLQTETEKCYVDIQARVVSANRHLAAAEKEFAEGAFAPFWDEIEHAANDLAAYKNEVEHLQRNVNVYNSEAAELLRLGGEAAAPLVVSPAQLPDARPAAARFMGIVRRAQTNFQFAMIFEQRKTNQLLHTGFGTLGAAIHSLGESINASLDKLAQSMDRNTDRLLSYQDPVRHVLTKMAARDQKPAAPNEPAEPPRLPRFDANEG